MLVLFVKAAHLMAAMFFLGFGMGSVFYKIRAYQSGDAAVIAFADREIVRADWLFTVPSGVVLPLSGLALVQLYHLSWDAPWILVGIGGFIAAGLTWLPAAFLQIRMRELSAVAQREGTSLPDDYRRAHRAWMILGVPSFCSAMLVLWAMIAKAAAF